MYKAVGIIMIVGALAGLIFKKADEIKSKYENLKEMKKAITYLKHEMSFSVSEISVLCRKMAEETSGPVSAVLSEAAEYLDNDKTMDFKEAWNKAKEQKELFTAEADKKIDEFYRDLGKKSLDIEMDSIKKTENYLEEFIKEEKEKCNKDKKLIYTLGAAACAAVVILMI